MLLLILGLVLFFSPHLLREVGLRQALIDSLPSVGAYKGLYSLLALAGLIMIVWGKSVAPFNMVWQPVYELRFMSHVLMIPALILFVAGNLPCSYLSKYLRNPMLLGVTFWGASHLWSNGDLASMLLFGSFTLWAASKFFSLGLNVAGTDKKPSMLWDIIALIVGLVLYVGISVYHGQMFGVGLSFA